MIYKPRDLLGWVSHFEKHCQQNEATWNNIKSFATGRGWSICDDSMFQRIFRVSFHAGFYSCLKNSVCHLTHF